MTGHSIPGRGEGGIGTSGPENFKTTPMKPDIAGKDRSMPASNVRGMKIKHRAAKKKSSYKNPKF